jgi:hypothetical protein
MISREQYEFTNLFFEDDMWDDKLPKCYDTDEDGSFINFRFLDEDEYRAFMKIKFEECPELLKIDRYEKLKRILFEY